MNDTTPLWATIYAGSGAVLVALVDRVFARRKTVAETESITVTASSTAVTILKGLIDELKEELERREQDCATKIEKLEARVMHLEQQIVDLGGDP